MGYLSRAISNVPEGDNEWLNIKIKCITQSLNFLLIGFSKFDIIEIFSFKLWVESFISYQNKGVVGGYTCFSCIFTSIYLVHIGVFTSGWGA